MAISISKTDQTVCSFLPLVQDRQKLLRQTTNWTYICKREFIALKPIYITIQSHYIATTVRGGLRNLPVSLLLELPERGSGQEPVSASPPWWPLCRLRPKEQRGKVRHSRQCSLRLPRSTAIGQPKTSVLWVALAMDGRKDGKTRTTDHRRVEGIPRQKPFPTRAWNHLPQVKMTWSRWASGSPHPGLPEAKSSRQRISSYVCSAEKIT